MHHSSFTLSLRCQLCVYTPQPIKYAFQWLSLFFNRLGSQMHHLILPPPTPKLPVVVREPTGETPPLPVGAGRPPVRSVWWCNSFRLYYHHHIKSLLNQIPSFFLLQHRLYVSVVKQFVSNTVTWLSTGVCLTRRLLHPPRWHKFIYLYFFPCTLNVSLHPGVSNWMGCDSCQPTRAPTRTLGKLVVSS